MVVGHSHRRRGTRTGGVALTLVAWHSHWWRGTRTGGVALALATTEFRGSHPAAATASHHQHHSIRSR